MSTSTLVVVLTVVGTVVAAAVYLHQPGAGESIHAFFSSLHGR